MKGVNIKVVKGIADLNQNRVVNTEHLHLHGLLYFTNAFFYVLAAGALMLQLFQVSRWRDSNLWRHTGQFSYVDTKAMLAATRYQLAQEDDLVTNFLNSNVIVLYATEAVAQFHSIRGSGLQTAF